MLMKAYHKIFVEFSAAEKFAFAQILTLMIGLSGLEACTAGLMATLPASLMDAHFVLTSTPMRFLTAHAAPLVGHLADPRLLPLGLAILSLFLILLKNILRSYQIWRCSILANTAAMSLGYRFLAQLYRAAYQWHLVRNSADMIYNMEFRLSVAQFILCGLEILTNTLMALGMGIFLLVLYPNLALILVAVILIGPYIIIIKSNKMMDLYTSQAKDLRESMNKMVSESIKGVIEIKVFNKSSYFLERYQDLSRCYISKNAWSAIWYKLPSQILEITSALLLLIVLGYQFFFQKTSQAETITTLAILAIVAWRLFPAIHAVVSALVNARYHMVYAENIQAYLKELDHQDAIVSLSTAPAEPADELVLDQLGYIYPKATTPSLDAITLRLPSGQSLGVVGRSGSGKSTLAACLLGLLLPQKGRVSFGNLDTSNARAWLESRLVGYVPQRPYLLDDSLLRNVAFGVPDDQIDRERVYQCLQLANLTDVLSGLKEEMDTPLGELGTALSGGQRQRVAIARSLYCLPRVLVLDEATSALDHQTEQAVMDTIRTLSEDMTVIVIAHRLSTVSWCDRILWLEAGRIRMYDRPEIVLPYYREANVLEVEPGETGDQD